MRASDERRRASAAHRRIGRGAMRSALPTTVTARRCPTPSRYWPHDPSRRRPPPARRPAGRARRAVHRGGRLGGRAAPGPASQGQARRAVPVAPARRRVPRARGRGHRDRGDRRAPARRDRGPGRHRGTRSSQRFGDRVAHIVLACTDDLTADDQPEPAPVAPRGAANWQARKEQYLAHLAHRARRRRAAGEPRRQAAQRPRAARRRAGRPGDVGPLQRRPDGAALVLPVARRRVRRRCPRPTRSCSAELAVTVDRARRR